MMAVGLVENVDFTSVFGSDQEIAVQSDRRTELIAVARSSVTQEKRIGAGIKGVMNAQSPPAKHSSVTDGDAICSGARRAIALVVKVESGADDREIFAQALVLTTDTRAHWGSRATLLLAGVVVLVDRV